MGASKILLALLLVGGAVGAAALAYDAARPKVHPIKAAEAREHPAAPPTKTTANLFGPAQIIYGDTLRVEGVEADLWTIVAPKLDLTCRKDGQAWACGEASRANLEKLIGGRRVACRPEGPPSPDDHWQGLCFVSDTPCAEDGGGHCESDLTSLNLAQVEQGWASNFEGQYSDSEEAARERKAGLWASDFAETRQ
ncbi:thermonuclease family protein [Caulobacter endophyticus]|uniref:thermonuclease family protein n=1 Tax=Caulobacter endophyticus TaxID=2172652 RepID=UPI00240FBF13|nr:thermonuclease family protein [Caulobacter endophyticus]MDG2530719.1 thermonuclease family protein [Caulobacter endophyticus]